MSYVVKNCPAKDYYKGEYYCMATGLKLKCVDIKECIMKKIIEKLKCYDNSSFNNDIAPFAKGILEILETKEAKND